MARTMSRAVAAGLLLAAGSLIPLPLAVAAGQAAAQTAAQPGNDRSAEAPPLFEGMGPHTRKITTDSPEAQRYFDQGLTWSYAFNHDEAVRSFEHAARLDPECAMAYWGVALVSGPHINKPMMEEARAIAAWENLQKAMALRDRVSPVERALIEALAHRYADPAAGPLPLSFEERAPLDRAYAEAMAEVYKRFPNDSDVATLYAEALMDLRPWDLWDRDGTPRPETPEVLRVLEHVLDFDPTNPGANHFYVHAVEASPFPAKASDAADRLRTLVPASSHLVHMPAHIDVRTGRWAQAAEQNRQAAAIDAVYKKISPKQGFYRIYMAHNDHFLAYACMMLGRRDEAIAAAKSMLAKIPDDWARENAAVIDGYTLIEIEAYLRFGLWDQLLAMDAPPSYHPIRTAYWRFARASALAAKGDLAAAEREQAAFRRAVKAIPEGAIMAINPADRVMEIAELTLSGELAYRRGQIDEAVSDLRRAAELEDQLIYMEPPDWVQPVRHSLGAILFEAGRYDEAEQVYREDLERLPENGWSLFGLARCLEAKRSPEARAVRARFEKAWQHADTKLAATCLCVAKAE